MTQDRNDASPASADAQAPAGGVAPMGISGRLRAFWRVPTYRFAVSFISYLTVISLGYPWLRLRFGWVLADLQRGTAALIYHILSLVSPRTDISLQEPTVFFLGTPMTVIEECTGIYEAFLLGAALLAYPTSWRNTAVGFAIGFPLIYALNVLRIIMLILVKRFSPGAFLFMHLYFWQVTMILTVVFVLYVFVRWVMRREQAVQAS